MTLDIAIELNYPLTTVNGFDRAVWDMIIEVRIHVLGNIGIVGLLDTRGDHMPALFQIGRSCQELYMSGVGFIL